MSNEPIPVSYRISLIATRNCALFKLACYWCIWGQAHYLGVCDDRILSVPYVLRHQTMIDFSLLATENAITMNDILVTVAAFLAGWTKMAQGEKDRQIRSRDETIAYLEKELKKCRERYEEPNG